MIDKTEIKISRRSFLFGLASIYIIKKSSLFNGLTLSNQREVIPVSINSNFYQWVLDKDDLK